MPLHGAGAVVFSQEPVCQESRKPSGTSYVVHGHRHADEFPGWKFRPDLQGKRNQEVYALTTPEGNDVVEVTAVAKITDRMARLAANQRLPASKQLQAWKSLFRQLTRILPPELPPLPSFEIIDG
jgi:hypothetical protein